MIEQAHQDAPSDPPGRAHGNARALEAVLALHAEVPNRRCLAAWHPPKDGPPGPPSPPLWCVKQQGHDGPHIRYLSQTEFVPNTWHERLPGSCAHDGEPWPCATVQAIEGATAGA